MAPYPELLYPAILALLCVLIVLPWHIRIRNLATLSMAFWMIIFNLTHIVNASMWGDDADNKAPVWCDISATIQVGYNYGLPLSHLLLARQLEALTSLRSRSVLYDEQLLKKKRIIDWTMTVGIPIAGILLHLGQQDRRFYILQGSGCAAATYWNAYGLIMMAIVPVLIAVAALIYTTMALVNIYLRRQKMLSLITVDSKTSKEQYVRLYILGVAEIGTCLLRAFFNITSYVNGPQPLGHFGDPLPVNLHTVSSLTKAEITPSNWRIQLLQWYTVTVCSFVFFLCFITGSETLRFYRRMLSKVFPCIPAPRDAFLNMSSAGSGSGSRGSSSGLGTKKSLSTFQSTDKVKPDTKFHFDRLDQMESGIVDPDQHQYELNYVQSPTTPSTEYIQSPADPPSTADISLAPPAAVASPEVRIESPSPPQRTARLESVDSNDTVARWERVKSTLSGRFE